VIRLAEVIHLSNFGAEICRLFLMFIYLMITSKILMLIVRDWCPREARKDAAPLVLILAFCHFALFGGWPWLFLNTRSGALFFSRKPNRPRSATIRAKEIMT
jgi:hypothetical protein